MTTKQYNTKDFAKASFARHPLGYVAARHEGRNSAPWSSDFDWLSDAEMVDRGWEPVQEAAAQPITLDTLLDAWESAEQADERNAGDVLIRQHQVFPTAEIEVWRSSLAGPLDPHTRILRRAPKPPRPEGAERLEALLDEWGDLTRGEEPTPLADWLAARGVRVNEGEGR